MKRFSFDPKKAVLAVLILAGIVGVTALICLNVGVPMLELASDPADFRSWLSQRKTSGQLVYMGMVLVQVLVAVIPGEPLEIAGGYAFGAIEGTVLCLLAETLSSILIFLLVRRFGVRLVRFFFSQEKLESVHFLKHSSRQTLLFLIVFMIPGTPKDLLCYFAGLTGIKLAPFILIASLGRIPSVITSTIGGDALGSRHYILAGIVFVLTMGISIAGLVLYKKICNRHNRSLGTHNPHKKEHPHRHS